MSNTARELGISRMGVYRWLKKARTIQGYYSEKNLQSKSTKPKKIKRLLNVQEQSDIIALREKTGFAAVKIKRELRIVTSINTIHLLLQKERSTQLIWISQKTTLPTNNPYAFVE